MVVIYQVTLSGQGFSLLTRWKIAQAFSQVCPKSPNHYPNSCCNTENRDKNQAAVQRADLASHFSVNMCVPLYPFSDPMGFRLLTTLSKVIAKLLYYDPGFAYVNLSSFSILNLISWNKIIPLQTGSSNCKT